MGEPDLFVSTEEEVEVDAETEAAIDRGLRDADEGRGVPAEQVRGLLSKWISNLSRETKP
jgi:predicted transcriptional regulator